MRKAQWHFVQDNSRGPYTLQILFHVPTITFFWFLITVQSFLRSSGDRTTTLCLSSILLPVLRDLLHRRSEIRGSRFKIPEVKVNREAGSSLDRVKGPQFSQHSEFKIS